MLGDTAAATRSATEAVRLLGPIGDAWGMVHAEAMLGAIANAEHRFGDAAAALDRVAALSEELGFAGQAALHLTTLGRVLQRAGDPRRASDTLARSAAAAGDRPLAARLLEEADGLHALVGHALDGADRLDAAAARAAS
jgi:hypothetical protein